MSLRKDWHDVSIWDVIDLADYALLLLFIILVTYTIFGRDAFYFHTL